MKTNKIVIYTCITGNYDTLHPIAKDLLSDKFDFICFTDNLNIDYPSGWIIKQLPEFVNNLSNVKKQRLIKILPHKCFAHNEYSASIWLDANIFIKKDLTEFFVQHDIEKIPLFVNAHPLRKCIYDEERTVVKIKKDKAVNTAPQIKRYLDENYPTKNGLAETNVLYRDHNNIICQTVSNTWSEEVLKGSHRDQLSFDYSCWKNAFKYGVINKTFKVNSEYFGKSGHRQSKITPANKNIKKNISFDELFSNSKMITIDDARYNRAKDLFSYYKLPIPEKSIGSTDPSLTPVKNCLISHRNIVKKAKENNLPFVLIFEDDAYPCTTILTEIQPYLKSLPLDIGVLLLGWSNISKHCPQPLNNLINKITTIISGAHAYIIFKSAYDHYLNATAKLNVTADGIFVKIPNSYMINKPIFIQYNAATSMNKHNGYILYGDHKNPPPGYDVFPLSNEKK